MNRLAGTTIKMRRLACALVVLLLVSLFVGSVEARGGTFVISPSGEAIEEIQLSPPDSVFGNMSVSGGFVEFFVTNPSNEVIYQNLKTSLDHFNFTADENGTFQMHFVNEYQSENVSVSLSYSINFFFFVSSEIHVTTSIFTTQTITLNGVIITRTQPHPYITLNVNPPGFPVVGQYWQISVFSESQSSDGFTYLSPLPNATVLVKVIVENQPTVYSSTTDEEGHLQIQFLPKYDDISFQAIYGGNESAIIGFSQQSEHYVRADFVELISRLSLFMSGVTAASEGIMLHYRKRIRVIFNLLIGAILCFSLVQLVISVYAQMNLLTPWGYPASIFDLVRWDSLGYASLVGLVLFAILNVLAYLFRPKSPEVVVPLK